MKYGDKVKVTSGFYEGCTGTLLHECTDMGKVTGEYFLRFGLTDTAWDTQVMNKDILELIE